jgi:NADH-quinone oxidoreductase subunit E
VRKANDISAEFAFNAENLQTAANILKRYPEGRGRSALVPLLELAQRQNNGFLSHESMEYIAGFLDLHYMQVYEAASFYTMFNLKPIGKNHIQICTTTPCWLKGSDEIVKTCEQELGIKFGETTKDGKYSLSEVECLGACTNAPVVQINDEYYEDLSPEKIREIIKSRPLQNS